MNLVRNRNFLSYTLYAFLNFDYTTTKLKFPFVLKPAYVSCVSQGKKFSRQKNC